MQKPRVYITRVLPAKGMQLIQDHCQMEVWPDELPPSREEILTRVPGVAGILSLLTDKIDAEVMKAAGSQLRVISNYAVGYNNIDIKAATERGIAVGNTPGILTDATADFAFALMLTVGRRILEAARTVRSGQWQTWGPSILLGSDFVGATLGLIGFGRIGHAMAKRASGFDMRVLYSDAGAEPAYDAKAAHLDTLLRESDFISLHVPLTADTHHLISTSAFEKMKSNAILINTARGEIVDPAALYDALKNRRIFGAALDVTEPEPLPMDSPLLELDNLIICPHIASASVITRENMAIKAVQNLLAGIRGEPLPNIVNPQIYE
ncbi:MAG: D-glycerate dehydrogenase [Chloroflexi bacterium HGW-Chloroflexi-10]|nr:MAG: D-glycerate dehydrogenase [Chloroflexi bacterium HGW-Chloroflexi-10]